MQADAVAAALAQAHRSEWAFVLSATVRVAGDLDVAEECAQEAYVSALQAWTRDGVPERPGAWLTTAARNQALDRLRREVTLRRKLPLLVEPATVDPHDPADLDWPDAAVPDDRLRLVFTCCHPTLAPEARVALTLRLVCGVPTPDVARAFLVSEPTMAARITRAKKKISEARIPYRVPGRAELPERLDSVLTAVHLLFSTGHTAGEGTRSSVRSSATGPCTSRAPSPRCSPSRPRPAACWACCSSPTRAGPPGPTSRAGCSCSPTRTGRAGTSARFWRGSR